jgi:hypothetical protein
LADLLFLFVFPDERVHGDAGAYHGEGEGSVFEVAPPGHVYDEGRGGCEGEDREKECQPEYEVVKRPAWDFGILLLTAAFRRLERLV